MADNENNPSSGEQQELEKSLDKVYAELLRDTTKETTSFVNILKEYSWNANSSNRSKFIPCAYIQEYRQNLSTFVASLEYYAHGTTSSVGGGGIIDTIRNTASNRPNKFNEVILGRSGTNDLAPYKYMYSLDDENCAKYVFPYLENDFVNISSNYNDKAQVGFSYQDQTADFFADNLARWTVGVNDIMSALNGGGDGKSPTWDNNGVFVERPKYFQFDSSGEKVTIRFPLFNTTYTPNYDNNWKKNYKFIKSFALKNLPFKVSMFRYKTPLLYEVAIPGVKYLPIAYVSNFSATMRGTRRMLSLSGNDDNRIIIPDAWDVTITFTSLLGKTANAFKAITEVGPQVIKL